MLFECSKKTGCGACSIYFVGRSSRTKQAFLVRDGLVSVEETADSPREYKKFIHELQAQATLADCTMFLLTGTPSPPIAVEHTMVDGVVQLHSELYGRRAERHLEMYKMRGTGYLRGEHSFRITDEGLVVYPRTEALLMLPAPTNADSAHRLKPGSQARSHDRRWFPRNSTALLTGPPGVGKTTLGLHFLSRCTGNAQASTLAFTKHPRLFPPRRMRSGYR